MSEIYRVSSLLKLYFVIENSYFDENDFSGEPIKRYMKPYYLTSLNDTSFYYYMLISKNDVTLNDNLLFGAPVSKSFIETRIDYKVS